MASTSNTFKNNYGRKKRRGRQRTTRQDKKIAKIASDVFEAKQKSETELKYIDIDGLTSTAIPNTGIIHHLSPCTEGTGYDERIGLKIKGKNLLLRFQLIHSDSTQMVRVMVIRWFCSTTPVVSDVVFTPSASTPWPLNPLNIDNSKEIQVLYDNLFALSTNTNANIVDKVFIGRPMHISFETDDTRDNGHLYLIAVSDSTAVSHPSITYWSRLRFTDV